MESEFFTENAFGVIGIYSSASMQVHQCKTTLRSELGQKQDLKISRNYYDGIIGLILKVNTLTEYILFMTTLNFQCSSLLLSKVIRVQSKQDNHVYKEMKGHVLWSQLPSDCKQNIGLENSRKPYL